MNWDILVGFLASFDTDPNFAANNESNRTTKEKARLLLRFLIQKNALSALSLQLDLMYIFKGMSEFTQKSGTSIAGAGSKKKNVIEGLDNVLVENGTFMKKLLADAKCEGMPCLTLTKYESIGERFNHNEVKYYDVKLIETIIPDSDNKGKVTEEHVNFVKTSGETRRYIDFIKEKIEQKMPSSEVLDKASILDNTKWNFNLRSDALNPTFQEKLKDWTTIYDDDYNEEELSNDFLAVVQFIEDNPTFWCANHFSDPTEFFSLLLRTMTTMPQKFKHVLEMTMVTPLSNADPER